VSADISLTTTLQLMAIGIRIVISGLREKETIATVLDIVKIIYVY
jgi:hypothetical protein